MRFGIKVESIYPRSFADNGLRLVGISLRLGENWLQPNGRLKDMACRELLLTLNRKGLITLPPRLTSASNEKRNRSIPVVNIDRSPLQEKLASLGFVDLKPARNTKFEPLYNSIFSNGTRQHLYLVGYRQIVGNTDKARQTITNDGQIDRHHHFHVNIDIADAKYDITKNYDYIRAKGSIPKSILNMIQLE